MARLAAHGIPVWRTDRDGTGDGAHGWTDDDHCRPARQHRARRPALTQPQHLSAHAHVFVHPTTIERFILEQDDRSPRPPGELSNLLYDIALAAKIIAAAIRRAGLVNVLGARPGRMNVQGEEQQKLDVFANETIKNALNHTGRVCVMASEEDEDLIPIPPEYPAGKYAVLFDPLDGSSNIDVNAAVGTIFSIYRRVIAWRAGARWTTCCSPGYARWRPGTCMYGSSTMLVYTTGQGVHGFTLDPTIGEFLLSHPRHHDAGRRQVLQRQREQLRPLGPGQSRRRCAGSTATPRSGSRARTAATSASFVADFHRNLINGGMFLYPADTKNPKGKLRLLYECSPMAFMAEQAGGAATDGVRPHPRHAARAAAPAGAAGDRVEGGRRVRRRDRAVESAESAIAA